MLEVFPVVPLSVALAVFPVATAVAAIEAATAWEAEIAVLLDAHPTVGTEAPLWGPCSHGRTRRRRMKTTQDRYPQILRNAYWLHVVAEVWADFLQLPDEINVLHAVLVHRSKSVKEQCNTHRSNDYGESTLQV